MTEFGVMSLSEKIFLPQNLLRWENVGNNILFFIIAVDS